MKFVSLFNKTPSNKKFNYSPRFYDQKEEERKEREERIRREIEREQGISSTDTVDYRSRIAGSFHSARRRSSQGKSELNAILLRSGLLLFMVLFAMAYLTWGRPVLYTLLLAVPIYFYLKFRK
ncbi:MAG: hypothetical protein SH819_07405 [Cytophagales bacterium]|nr:hypothetical protein [Cytophagales bacterium]